MRYMAIGAILALALLLAACRTTPGAGATQDPCGLATVKASTPGGGTAQAQSQALESGQKASNQPVQTDPAKWTPFTTWGGGAGAVEASNTVVEERSQAGAPSSNMLLIQPATQEQSQYAGGGGTHPQLRSLDMQLKAANMRLSAAASRGDTTTAEKEYALIEQLNEAYAKATISTAKNVTVNYNFQESYNTLGMSSSSTASGDPGKASTSEEGTSVSAAEIAEKAGAVPPTEVSTEAPVGTVIELPPGVVPVVPEPPLDPAVPE